MSPYKYKVGDFNYHACLIYCAVNIVNGDWISEGACGDVI
jgi:hypothetical protein